MKPGRMSASSVVPVALAVFAGLVGVVAASAFFGSLILIVGVTPAILVLGLLLAAGWGSYVLVRRI